MKTRRLILLAMWCNCLAFTATADTKITRPGPCASQGVYLLAGNSGALLRVDAAAPDFENDVVIVYRQQSLKGWASQHLLRRFDLQLEEDGPVVVNSGAFCTGGE